MINEFNNIKLPSNEKFGNFFSLVFFILSIYFLYFDYTKLFIIFLILSVFTIFLRFFIPSILIYPNKAWMFIGFLLNKIVSPIVLGFIFYIIITPVGLIRRVNGNDELKLKNIKQNSFWVKRDNDMLKTDKFTKQF